MSNLLPAVQLGRGGAWAEFSGAGSSCFSSEALPAVFPLGGAPSAAGFLLPSETPPTAGLPRGRGPGTRARVCICSSCGVGRSRLTVILNGAIGNEQCGRHPPVSPVSQANTVRSSPPPPNLGVPPTPVLAAVFSPLRRTILSVRLHPSHEGRARGPLLATGGPEPAASEKEGIDGPDQVPAPPAGADASGALPLLSPHAPQGPCLRLQAARRRSLQASADLLARAEPPPTLAVLPDPAFSSPGCWGGRTPGLLLAASASGSAGRRQAWARPRNSVLGGGQPRGMRPLVFCSRLWKLVADVPSPPGGRDRARFWDPLVLQSDPVLPHWERLSGARGGME